MGRPKLKHEKDRKIPLTVSLQKADIKKIKKYGRGNSSEGIRHMLRLLEEKTLQNK